ncbi:hypothetical protein LEP1GSC052_3430 [Leptospira kmetyi serovar Malaysia str. Bejo-Iso9]|nr:hypothetical protein LEP1GSC052_3430 [Leptospira kmetyi serovar Malaysia str. Bejo-Iso9]
MEIIFFQSATFERIVAYGFSPRNQCFFFTKRNTGSRDGSTVFPKDRRRFQKVLWAWAF